MSYEPEKDCTENHKSQVRSNIKSTETFIKHPFVLAAISGLLLSLAYPGWGVDLGFLVWVGLVPLAFSLILLKHANASWKKFFLAGFLAGLVYFLLISRWLWSAHPLSALGISNAWASFVLILATYVLGAAAMALFWGFFGILSGYAANLKKPNVLAALIISAVFVLLEYARAFGFGILWIGSGTLLGPHWTVGNAAYSLASNNLILKLASFAGIYGVDFLIKFIGFLLAFILWKSIQLSKSGNQETTKKYVGAAVLILVFVELFSLIGTKIGWVSKKTGKEINFAAVQINQADSAFPSSESILRKLNEQLVLLEQIAEKYPETQVVVFPEATDFLKNLSVFLTAGEAKKFFKELFKEPALIVSGSTIAEEDKTFSRVFFLDTQEGIIGYHNKGLLAPGSEFLPYFIKFPASFFLKEASSAFSDVRELDKGELADRTLNFRGQFRISPIICSEIISPSLNSETSENSEVIVAMASYAMLKGNNALVEQQLANSKFRAAENQKPLISASNMGLSFALNRSGGITAIVPNKDAQILTGRIVTNDEKTWYNRAGDFPVLLGLLMLAGISQRNKIANKKDHAT